MSTNTVTLTASPDLADLMSQYRAAKAALDAATDHADALKAQLKTALWAMSADLPTLLAKGQGIAAEDPASGFTVKLRPTTSWRLDTTRIKAEQPVLYAAYAKQSTSWALTVSEG